MTDSRPPPLPPDYDGKSFFKKTGSFVVIYWSSMVMIFWPLLTLPLLISYWEYKEARCGWVIVLMGVYWVTGCIPIAAASLMPVAFYPLFGIMGTTDTAKCYMNDTIMMFIGGLVLSTAVEHSGLHVRIALRVMTLVGCSHKKLMGGLMIVTTFMSMWMSNTSCTAMMMPIIFAVLEELEKEGIGKVFNESSKTESGKEATTVTRGYLMAAAYASTFGGTATFVGTGTNLTFRGLFEHRFPKYGHLSFTDWMLYGTPQAYTNSFMTWVYMQIYYFGMFRPSSNAAKESTIGTEGEAIATRVMAEKYRNLGAMTFHERMVLIFFLLTVILWVTSDPGFTVGWYYYILLMTQDDPYAKTIPKIQDSTPVMLITLLLFIIPKEPAFLHICSKDANKRPKDRSEGLLTWNVLEKKIPWGMIFLLGGGFCISQGGKVSGLSERIGESLESLKILPPFFILCCVVFLVGFITEFTSNVGVANIVLPVLHEMCVNIKVNPLYLAIPATVACSYSFRLPVGTPPNALIALHGEISTKYLLAGGCLPSLYGMILVILTWSTYGTLIFHVDPQVFPDWAQNKTSNDTL